MSKAERRLQRQRRILEEQSKPKEKKLAEPEVIDIETQPMELEVRDFKVPSERYYTIMAFDSASDEKQQEIQADFQKAMERVLQMWGMPPLPKPVDQDREVRYLNRYATVRDGMRTIFAKFQSRCAHCSKRVSVGDQVVWDRDNKIVYHPECAPKGATDEKIRDEKGRFEKTEDAFKGVFAEEQPASPEESEGFNAGRKAAIEQPVSLWMLEITIGKVA